jgi:hypothetical protein
MSPIFISYRRSDSEGVARCIYDRLVAYFGKPTIFGIHHIRGKHTFYQSPHHYTDWVLLDKRFKGCFQQVLYQFFQVELQMIHMKAL